MSLYMRQVIEDREWMSEKREFVQALGPFVALVPPATISAMSTINAVLLALNHYLLAKPAATGLLYLQCNVSRFRTRS
jgi:hypothetical protein